jgi:hypothetical protein
LADRLRDGEFPWTTAILDVDGAATEFDVLIVDDEWAAFTNLDDDVSIECSDTTSHSPTFRLVRFTGAAASAPWKRSSMRFNEIAEPRAGGKTEAKQLGESRPQRTRVR